MYTPCCLALLLLFLVNVSRIGTELCVSVTTQDSSVLPRSFRQASCSRNVHHFPCSTKFRGLSILLLLCGDISLNPGPISFGVVNCRSIRNKGPSISDMMSTDSFSILAMTETHIRPSDNDSFLRSITPLRYALPIVLSLFSQIKSEKSGTPLLTLTPSLFLLLQMYPNLTFSKQFLRMKYGK